ncbi:MAG: hypothetical protein RMJ15_06395 [Nitrososphaerota archaeon]|nr:hypothetical protein [Candidatus Bathyarchaeota archaeon]MDW8023348.1 hypothetical protein [Nitrososphaerota archaeon]
MESEDAKVYEDVEPRESHVGEEFVFDLANFPEGEIGEKQLQELLKSVSEEALQLSKFLAEEDNLIKEVCISLKQILKKINAHLDIQPGKVPIKANLKKAMLDEKCHLVLVNEKGEVHSAFLAEYPPEIVMSTLLAIMPELIKAITAYRRKITVRIELFENIKKELKNILKAIIRS